jgi:hypothetical protein
VKFSGIKSGSENQNKETKKDTAMHNSRVYIFPCFDLEKSVHNERLYSCRKLVHTDFILAHRFPELPAFVNTVGEYRHGNGSKKKKERLKTMSVPENLTTFIPYSDRANTMMFH